MSAWTMSYGRIEESAVSKDKVLVSGQRPTKDSNSKNDNVSVNSDARGVDVLSVDRGRDSS
jgi:hypothetical protein